MMNGYYYDAQGREQFDGEMANMQADHAEELRQQQQPGQPGQPVAACEVRYIVSMVSNLLEAVSIAARSAYIGQWMSDEAVYIQAKETVTRLLDAYPMLAVAGDTVQRMAQDAYLRELGR